MAYFYCLMDNIYFPEWAVCLHEYGDTEGLTDDDLRAYESFMNSVGHQAEKFVDGPFYNFIIEIDTDDDCVFIHHPAFGLACNCYKAKVWVFAKER